MTFLNELRVLILAHQNRLRSMFLEFLERVEEGRSPVKRNPEGLLWRFWKKLCFNFHTSKQGSVYVFRILVDSRVGNPDNVFLRVYFDVLRKSSRFTFSWSKQSLFYVFGVFVYLVCEWLTDIYLHTMVRLKLIIHFSWWKPKNTYWSNSLWYTL